MAKVCNSRAKVYEARGVANDEPVEHLESEGERLIKQMVKNQLDTHVSLDEELKRETQFQSVSETLPLTEYVCGERPLKEFQRTVEEAEHIEELRSFGLSNDEINILLNFERNALSEKYRKTDQTVLSAQLNHILEKCQLAKRERDGNSGDSALCSNRHQKELGLCVKPESQHTKLLNFILSCQKTRTDPRPLDHPINHLKSIEEGLFGHLTGRPAKSRLKQQFNRSRANTFEPETQRVSYSYEGNCSLWDVKPEQSTARQKKRKRSAYTFTCKPEYLYTIKNGEIVPVTKPTGQDLKPEKQDLSHGDECVVTDLDNAGISLIPLEDISRNRLTLQEIKSIPRFSNYSQGIPSKVLYLKNLGGSVTNDDLVSLFGRFESSKGARVVYRLLTGRMRGQAFVTFPNATIAEEALKMVNGFVLKGKPIIMQYGKEKSNSNTSES